jgi:electron transfer flavoprotein alpha subunit
VINADVSELSKYGVDKVLKVTNDKLAEFTAKKHMQMLLNRHKKEIKLVFSSTTQLIFLHW